MDGFNVITPLEDKLKAYVSLTPLEVQVDCWSMKVQLYYEGELGGMTQFTLEGYNQEEAERVARNIKSNPYVMREIDEYLWGESD